MSVDRARRPSALLPWWDVYFAIAGRGVTVAVTLLDRRHPLGRRPRRGRPRIAGDGRRCTRRSAGRRDRGATPRTRRAVRRDRAGWRSSPSRWWRHRSRPGCSSRVTPHDLHAASRRAAVLVADRRSTWCRRPARPSRTRRSCPATVLIAVVSGGGRHLARLLDRPGDRAERRARPSSSSSSRRAGPRWPRLSHEAGVAAERPGWPARSTTPWPRASPASSRCSRRPTRSCATTRRRRWPCAPRRKTWPRPGPWSRPSRRPRWRRGHCPIRVRRQASRFSEETGVPATVRITGAERRAADRGRGGAAARDPGGAGQRAPARGGRRGARCCWPTTTDEVRLTVRDDGRGFDPGAPTDGFGLTGMRARAEQVERHADRGQRARRGHDDRTRGARVIRILLVDDHPVVRLGSARHARRRARPDRGRRGLLGRRGLALALAERPDIVLMDLRMPGGDGVSATERILAAAPATRVLVLTTYESDRDILRAIEAGAGGYLLKDALAGRAGRRGPGGGPRRDRARAERRVHPGAPGARRPRRRPSRPARPRCCGWSREG